MGNCFNPKHRNQNQAKSQAKTINLYKAKTSSNKLVCYRPEKRSFWEIDVTMNGMFQPGCLVAMTKAGKMLFIGGTESDAAFQVDLEKKTAVQIRSPPMPLAYGRLHIYQNQAYVIGAISIEEETEVAPLMYRMQTDTWYELPAMPTSVALSGSFLINQTIYVLGGFLNYPRSPMPFRSIMQFDITKQAWGMMNIETPIRQGLPACAVITQNSVLIVGGHDPMDAYDSEESRRAYIFDFNQFQRVDDLPDVGQLHFMDPPMLHFNEVLLFSDDEILFKFDLNSQKWSSIDTEASVAPVGEGFAMSGNFIYHYLQEDCALLSYNIDTGERRQTGPSSFRRFYRHTGFCILPDGKLFFAGGNLDDEVTASCWMLEPSSRQPLAVADLPHAQYGVRLVPVGRQIYGVAGLEVVNGQKVCRCQCYSLDEQEWDSIEPMPYPTLMPGCCYFTGKVFCIGGMVDEGCTCNLYLVQAYTPNGQWSVMPVEYPIGVVSPGVHPISGNKLLCFGGILQSGQPVRKTFVFDGDQFMSLTDLPEPDEQEEFTTFEDPIVRSADKVYAFNKAGGLLQFHLPTQQWTILPS